MSRARRRDRRVYLAGHPVLFALLSATRRIAALRLGRTVLVHGPAAYRETLTDLPLDRTAAGTTGGIARDLAGTGGVLFDQAGPDHRGARRETGLGTAAVTRLRPLWTEVLGRRVGVLANGGTVDVVDVAVEVAGTTAAALLDLAVDPRTLAVTAREVAAHAARAHLPGWRPRSPEAARRATAALLELTGGERAAMMAVAAVNTTVAALPRAVAWCADDRLWHHAADPAVRPVLVDELLRVLAPAPLLPRVAAADGTVGTTRIGAGDRLILVARHAAGANRGPDVTDPAPASVSQLVFGAGPHACPGAGLARAQLADALAAFAHHRPVVSRARVDRRAALPGWALLEVRMGSS